MSESPKKAPKKPPLTNISLAGKVSRDVELDAVLLTKAQLTSHVDPDFEQVELAAAQQHRTTYQVDPERSRIKVDVGLRFQLADPKNSERVFLSLNAEYRLVYSVPQGRTYDQEALKYFAELNGMVNAWPYWRELVHTVAARVGLGSITLPVYRAKPLPVTVAETRP